MKKNIILLFFVLLSMLSHAGIESYVGYMSPQQVSSLGTDNTYDARFGDMLIPGWQNQFFNHSVKNRVWIGYQKGAYPQGTENVSVSLKIESWTHNGSIYVYNTTTQTLSLSSTEDPTLTMKDMATYSFGGAHRIRVTVLSVTGASEANIYVKSLIEVDRSYYMDQFTINTGFRNDPNMPGYLEFFWEEENGAEYYDLEWTYVSNHDVNPANQSQVPVPATDLEYDFYKNSTRVSISNAHYSIPKIFNKGYVILRVRSVGKKENNYSYQKTGDWTLPESGNVGSLNGGQCLAITQDYETDKNWVHGTTYTDKGKRFDGVTFSDGLGFTRQSVSANTETGQVVYSNVYYDRIGRPAISDLPTPENTTNLKHISNFNEGSISGVETAYGFQHYDYVTGNSPCLNPAFPFAESKGAGKYYSPNNPDKEGANANIPDADGYAFNQVEYMNDQTGRIRRSGAYGSEHQLGDHDTRFYYDIPSQEELNQLFGTEVGLKEHYQRKITIDPNGQAYAEYFDLAGRVVAHCLVGENPQSLDRLDNNPLDQGLHVDVIYDRLNQQNFDTEQGIATISAVKTIVSAGNYIFDHHFDVEHFSPGCVPEGFCYDCVYDLELAVTSIDCPSDPAYGDTIEINGQELLDINSDCDMSHTLPLSFTAWLNTGQYQITKTLRVREGAADAFWCNYAENLTDEDECRPDYADIYIEMYDETSFDCNGRTVTEEIYGNECDAKRALMRADLSPNGQYGRLSGDDPLSVYNLLNTLPLDGSWKTPPAPYKNPDYLTDAKIYLVLVDGQYSPAPDDLSHVQTDAFGSFIYPQHLNEVSDFASRFELSWADALLPYHPEYCYLQFCEQNNNYHSYNETLGLLETYDQACEAGLLSFGEDFYENSGDGFFLNAAWQEKEEWFERQDSDFESLKYKLGHYYTSPSSSDQYGTNYTLFEYSLMLYGNIDPEASLAEGCESDAIADCDKPAIWKFYKEELMRLRREYYLLLQTAYVSYPFEENEAPVGSTCAPSFNGCIGATATATTVLQFGVIPNQYKKIDLSTQTIAQTGPCFHGQDNLYADKAPRFQNLPAEAQIMSNPFATAGSAGDVDDLLEIEIAGACNTICNSYVEDWMASLGDCPSISDMETNAPATYAQFKSDLVNVCKNGCDRDNPQGATTINPANTTAPYASFEEVFDHYIGLQMLNPVCSPYLISEPRAYGQNIGQVQSTTLDQCGCNMVTQAEADYIRLTAENGLPEGVNSVADMLFFNTGILLSGNDIEFLLCKCRSAMTDEREEIWNAQEITQLNNLQIQVGPELTCGNSGDCQTCEEMATQEENFFNYFNCDTEAEKAALKSYDEYELLFANYLNQQLNFHLSYEAYETYLESCNRDEDDPGCYITEQGRIFRDLINIIARQGAFLTPQNNAYALLERNIVYASTDFSDGIPGSDIYWTEYDNDDANTLILHFGNTIKKLYLTLPLLADFGFEDIIGVTGISAVQNCPDKRFTLTVKVLKCGQIVERELTGDPNNFAFMTCYCDGNSGTLCDDLTDNTPQEACYKEKLMILNSLSESRYNERMQDIKEEFERQYIAKCSEAFHTEKLTMTGRENYYQYTLYYYDQANNLFKTVAPAGVFTPGGFPGMSTVDDQRTAQAKEVPHHDFETNHIYNSYNQVTNTSNPDQVGKTEFFYDFYGRLVASQNPVQRDEATFSYTLFDTQGRPEQTGLAKIDDPLIREDFKNARLLDDLSENLKSILNSTAVVKTEVHITRYDKALSPAIEAKFRGGVQQNIRLRVASVLYFDELNGSTNLTTDYASAIHYSYDAHGNVTEQLQDVPDLAPVEQDLKSTQYDFELISGNVTKVRFQEGQKDEMVHRYTYDNMERLRTVHTSHDGVHEARDAHYHYFDYGPLARVEIGELQVQASDYAYTINGWLKGANSTVLKPEHDTGNDGTEGYYSFNSSQNIHFARDIASYGLGYFPGDYKGIGAPQFEADPGGDMATAMHNLYNGNIAYTTTSIDGFALQSSVYSYDQLQRLTGMRVFRSKDVSLINSWDHSIETNEYKNSYTYDLNSNLKTLKRNATVALGLAMDDFSYAYPDQVTPDPSEGVDDDGLEPWNRLDRVTDGATAYIGTDDIKPGQTTANYSYDKLGQLLADADEDLAMHWRLGDKKLVGIEHGSGEPDAPNVEFVYNPFGQRILKIEKGRTGGVEQGSGAWKYTYYAYDANGQVMAVYNLRSPENEEGRATLNEQHIYGAERLGMLDRSLIIHTGTPDEPEISPVTVNKLGEKRYELTNHLGNVNVVINDRKFLSDYTEEIITFDEIEPTQGTGTDPCSMNNWYNNAGTNVSLEEISPDNNAWLIENTVVSYGGSNISICQYPDEEYTLNVNVLEKSPGTNIRFVVRDADGDFITLVDLAVGENTFSYTYNGSEQRARIQFQVEGIGSMLIDNMSITGAGMVNQYPGISRSYTAVPLMKADYYPFGMTMPGRIENMGDYRYAYNGMETDNELKGNGNSYTTEFRQYDPRIGRWMSLDPLMLNFPWMSPYTAFDNNPVYFVDPFGLESGNKGGPGGKGEDGTDGGNDAQARAAKANSESNPTNMPMVIISAGLNESQIRAIENRKAQANELHKQLVNNNKKDGNNVVVANQISFEQQKKFDEYNAIKQASDYRLQHTIDTPNKNQAFSNDMWNRYGDYVAPKELIDKLVNGEEIGFTDILIEGIGLIPAGKLFTKGGKLFAKIGKNATQDITEKTIKVVCFTEGTKIKSQEGKTNIEEIKIGDKVWSYDVNTDEIALKSVSNTSKRDTDHLQKLVIGTDTIFTTDEHPFYVSSTWKSASKLVIGDTLTLANKEHRIITYKERIDTIITVYNFTVEDYHTYFVGDQGILVHNDCSQPLKKTAKEIAKNCKKMTESQIEQLLGVGWHKNGSKTKLVKKYSRELKGSTNADFYLDKNSKEILLRGNKSNEWVRTGLFLD